MGIVGFVDVPVVHFSVQWWRTLHPGPVIDARGGPALPPAMLAAWMVTLAAVLLLMGTLVATRYLTERRREQAQTQRERQELGRLETGGEPQSGLPARAPDWVGR